MTLIRRHSIIFFGLFVFISQLSFAQKKSPTEWPYGGVPDTSRLVRQRMIRAPLNFPSRARFFKVVFDSSAYFGYAQFDSLATFMFVQFDIWADFGSAQFASRADFGSAKFHSRANFRGAQFHGSAGFNTAQFDGEADFGSAQFDSLATFMFAQFDLRADFGSAQFASRADFGSAKFHSRANFGSAQFHSEASFGDAEFDGLADFRGAQFHGPADFYNAKFHDEVFFEGSIFGESVNLAAATFKKEVDFRRTRLDSVEIIYIDHHTVFPEGKLRLYWNQFRGKDKLRLKLHNPSEYSVKADSIKEHYQRIETFYHRLRDNFLAQGNKGSADAVMYELCLQRDEIIGDSLWKLYGVLFGWGYKPFRFLVYIVLPIIIIFAGLWYWFFYPVLAKLFEPDVVGKIPGKFDRSDPKKDKIISIFKKIRIRSYDHSRIKNDINFLARFWQVIFFSSGVLLGIRFRRKWIQRDNKNFLNAVTIEWFIGKGLYVTFVVLVKSDQFAYIKGLLGF